MTNRILTSSLVLVLGLLHVSIVYGQKGGVDPRPLTGLDRSHIRTYSSVQEYLDAVPRGDLRAGAERAVGTGSGRRALALPAWGKEPLSAARSSRRGDGVLPRIHRAPNGAVRWMEGNLSGTSSAVVSAGKSQDAAAVAAVAIDVLDAFGHDLKLDHPAEELDLMNVTTDPLGFTHVRFEQTYQGLPVWGRDLYVHFDPEGSAYLINGTYEPTPKRADRVASLARADAHATVLRDLKLRGRWAPVEESLARALGLDHVEERLVLYLDRELGWRLAYEISLHPNLLEWFTYVVDARSGEVLNRIARHCTALPVNDPPPAESFSAPALRANVAGSTVSGTFASASATDLNAVNRSLRVFQADDGMFYQIWDLPNLNPANVKLPAPDIGGSVVLTANNTDFNEQGELYNVSATSNAWSDPSAVSAHFSAAALYEYYRDTFGRKAIDDQDQSIVSIIHVTQGGRPMDNAFWNGRIMAYGDGDRLVKPMAGAIDIAAHEMTHGVIGSTAALVYQYQSGALNESFADVFGAMFDREDFLLGEDVMLPGNGPAARDMENPGNPQLLQPQPGHMSEYKNMGADDDNGGVHVNSGIPNRAAALIIQSIGHDKAQHIYYRALTSYLTRNSEFGDARKALAQSAVDLHGAESPEVAAVHQAFDAVGVTESTSGGGGGEGDPVPAQTGGQSLVTFMLEDGKIGILDLTNPQSPQTFVFENQLAFARANLAIGDMSQLTAPRNGESIWFVNGEGQLAFVEVRSGDVAVFQDLYIQQPGDLWTASVSPDESLVALVSAYTYDPTLYLFNGQELSAIELKPESSQEGIFVETIQYPDVVAWSPNPDVPRIAFDAYNEVSVQAGSAAYWGMYEIDFASQKIYDLVPGQPSNISVGNVTYSSTRASLVAFNVIDQESVFDVAVVDYDSGDLVTLGLPKYSYQGTPITDAQRPTFAPDDAFLAFSSPSLGLMLFFEPSGPELMPLELGVSVYNPRWFVLGGTSTVDAEEEQELPSSAALHGNYPNPFNPATTIRFSLKQGTEIRLEVFDVMGRRVGSLVEGLLPAGAHEIIFEADGLASGTYIARLFAGGEVASHKMLLIR